MFTFFKSFYQAFIKTSFLDLLLSSQAHLYYALGLHFTNDIIQKSKSCPAFLTQRAVLPHLAVLPYNIFLHFYERYYENKQLWEWFWLLNMPINKRKLIVPTDRQFQQAFFNGLFLLPRTKHMFYVRERLECLIVWLWQPLVVSYGMSPHLLKNVLWLFEMYEI